MKILFLSPHFAEYSVSLAMALAREHEVLLVLNQVNAANELPSGFAVPPGLRLRIVRLSHDRRLATLWRNLLAYLRLAREFKPDLVHCQEEPKDYLVGFVALRWWLPMVLTVHDPRPHQGLDAHRERLSRLVLYRRFLRWRAKGVLVHGEQLRAEALATGQFRCVPVLAMPHGPLGTLVPSPPVKAQPWHCLFFGRIEAYKGLGVLIDALDLLQQRGALLHAVIAGRGTDLPRWRERLSDPRRFTLIERYLPADEVLSLFSQANVVVLPYLEGTQSGVAAYALGLGRALVGTAVGSIPDMVRDGENGVLVPPGDAEALANALQRMFNDPALCQVMGERSRQLGDTELSWRTAADCCTRLYRQCLFPPASGAV